MNREVIEEKIERLRSYLLLTDDYIECRLLEAKIDVLETILSALVPND